ncbi:hypothetical protein AAFF_G00150530 [Aldrovandia affinis]|uniref:Uncharacterized protein n=1 Tax=Aldrovandia affinis TaxID=143900 RepID=A0AAD7RP82_9TELE|nr:hypothetical protein AAFF_G00150530 [Aldrovandia affinis]
MDAVWLETPPPPRAKSEASSAGSDTDSRCPLQRRTTDSRRLKGKRTDDPATAVPREPGAGRTAAAWARTARLIHIPQVKTDDGELYRGRFREGATRFPAAETHTDRSRLREARAHDRRREVAPHRCVPRRFVKRKENVITAGGES